MIDEYIFVVKNEVDFYEILYDVLLLDDVVNSELVFELDVIIFRDCGKSVFLKDVNFGLLEEEMEVE